MIQVRALCDFPLTKKKDGEEVPPCFVKQFFGKTYEEAVDKANLDGTFSHYYQQEFGKNNNRQAKSILVAYQGVV